jgi:hypothetical protein
MTTTTLCRLSLVAVAFACLSACGGEDGATKGAPSIGITQPADGDTVAATFTLEVEVGGIDLELGPSDELIAGAGHWHVTVDGVPASGPLTEQATEVGPLAPGERVVEVGLYANDDDATAIAEDSATVTVEGP